MDKEREHLTGLLRSSAAWLRLAAERLEEGDDAAAYNMARLGAFGAEGMPERIDQLNTEVSA